MTLAAPATTKSTSPVPHSPLSFGASLNRENPAVARVEPQIGVRSLRADVIAVITASEGVTFDEAWWVRLQIKFADQPAAVLSKDHLICNTCGMEVMRGEAKNQF